MSKYLLEKNLKPAFVHTCSVTLVILNTLRVVRNSAKMFIETALHSHAARNEATMR